MILRQLSVAALAAGLLGTPILAQGVGPQSFGAEAGLSTLGFYVAPHMQVAPKFRLRTPFYFVTWDGDISYEGNNGTGSVDVLSFHLMTDYQLGNSGARLSGGVSFGGYDVRATFPGSFTLDGTTYNATITGRLQQDRQIAPVLSVGYNHTFNDRWGLVAELGARIVTMQVTATGQDALSPADLAAFNADLAAINRDLDDLRVTPFLMLGLSYNF